MTDSSRQTGIGQAWLNGVLSSRREAGLWMGTLAVVGAIYSTLGWARTLADTLREHQLLQLSFVLLLVIVVGGVLVAWVKRRPGWRDIGVGLGIALAYWMVFVRMENPAERTHLIEYGIVAALIHQALLERIANGFSVPRPAAITVLATALLGFVDECIQGRLAGRVFDWNDVFFNALAGFMVIVARLAITPAKLPGWRLWFLWFMAGAIGWGICMDVGTFGPGRRFVIFSGLPSIDIPRYESVGVGGILVGVLQCLLLRPFVRRPWRWILAAIGASVVGMVLMLGVGFIDRNLGWGIGVVGYGFLIGIIQGRVLATQGHRILGWVLVSALAWVVSLVTGDLGGPPGWSVYGALTGAYLVWVLRRADR